MQTGLLQLKSPILSAASPSCFTILLHALLLHHRDLLLRALPNITTTSTEPHGQPAAPALPRSHPHPRKIQQPEQNLLQLQ